MKTPRTALAALALCLTIGAVAFYGFSQSTAVADDEQKAQKDEEKPGLPEAPKWTLQDQDGNSHSLADYRGQYVVLEWVNHQCPFVVKFYRPGQMQKWQEHYTSEGIVWFKICSSAPRKQGYNTPEGWQRITEEKGVNATATLIDADGTVGRAYNATHTPQFAIINPDGKLIYNGAIDSIRSTNSADIERADNYMTTVLDAALLKRTRPYGCTIKY